MSAIGITAFEPVLCVEAKESQRDGAGAEPEDRRHRPVYVSYLACQHDWQPKSRVRDQVDRRDDCGTLVGSRERDDEA